MLHKCIGTHPNQQFIHFDLTHYNLILHNCAIHVSQERFDIPHDGAREWVLDKYNECWRGWKHMLKQTCYDPEDPLEENLKVPSDEGLIAEQWVKLVTHWENPKTVV